MLDIIDKCILDQLQKDAKMPIKALAASLKLTATPVYERIKRLEQEGYIKFYGAKLDREKIGLPLMALCHISLDQHQDNFIQSFESNILQFEEVRACYHTAGIYDYLIEVHVTDMAAYQKFITHKLSSLDHIGKVQSSFVMKVVKEPAGYPIP
jgi:DNA-binding Lrp family transcriptional regulator